MTTSQTRPLPHAPATETFAPGPVLEVRDLRVHYATPHGDVIAVNGVSFDVRRGEILGLVGESGCGKSTTAMAILRLVLAPGRIVGGQILLNGTDLAKLNERRLNAIRWRDVALIPQGAMNSLNPVMKVKDQIADAIETHEGKQPARVLKERILDILATVGLPPHRVYGMFPHELSGGMKQRVAMAIAISLSPKVIIADEPTSALDVVVQKQVMLTLSRLQHELNAAVVLIGHDMGLIAQFADSIGVLYAGKLVERGSVNDVLDNPLHPYTRLLIDSLPDLEGKRELFGIPGLPPELLQLPSGCPFHPRCPMAMERCQQEIPVIQSPVRGRQVACHLYPQYDRLPDIETAARKMMAATLSVE